MYKKFIIIICLILLVGCSKNINKLSLNEIIDEAIESNQVKTNTNSKGFKYYLPSGFNLYKDNGYKY